jgi:tetratricopeptide (TPR) repeat protein
MNDGKTTLTLNKAISAYKSGQLVEAERLCQQIVDARQDVFDALHLLALLQSLLGKKATAVASFDRALKLRPGHAEALCNRGLALYELTRFEEALTSFDRALNVKPDYAEAHHNRGLTLHQLKRCEEALACYDRALKVRPDYAETLSNRGATLQELKRFQEALADFDRALALQPHFAEALSNRCHVLCKLKRFEEALASNDNLVKAQPDNAEALCARGVILGELKRFEEALAGFDAALKMQPDHAEALSNRALVLHELRRFDDALASGERALKVRPDYAEALSNCGITLKELSRFEEALASFDRALKVRPDFAEALSNRGLVLHELRRFDEALTSYERALRVRPDFAEAHYNDALCRLLIGDFERGWAKNEWRWETEQQREANRNFGQPLWLGSGEIADKTILVHGEQGFGDMIQFCRYVPSVAERAQRVVLEIPEPLHELMVGALAGTAQLVTRGKPLPHFDMHCPLLSLPLAFKTSVETIPSAVPYLYAAPQAMLHWNERLGPRDRLRIGLVWSGRPTHKNDRNRSIRLCALLPLLDLDAVFVSLQPDVRAEDATTLKDVGNIIHFGHELKNFSDTAALISNLDLIISVDTSVAHLAGALGKPVWVLLPFVPDWRWLLDREDSPWYPTARLFRQNRAHTWDEVITRVRGALLNFTAKNQLAQA